MTQFLYAVEFDNGLIKVGRSASPATRIAQHAERISVVGAKQRASHIAECLSRIGDAESELINRCVGACAGSFKREWFSGLSFEHVRSWINEIAHQCRDQAEAALSDAAQGCRGAVKAACDALGGAATLANAVGVWPSAVTQWKKGERPVPPERCVLIEKATSGAVTRRDLRPNDWRDIWPELAEQEAH